jgi:hypothetical protein
VPGGWGHELLLITKNDFADPARGAVSESRSGMVTQPVVRRPSLRRRGAGPSALSQQFLSELLAVAHATVAAPRRGTSCFAGALAPDPASASRPPSAPHGFLSDTTTLRITETGH